MNKRQHCVCLQQMSPGLRKSTKSRFIAPLLPTHMVNNNMDTDIFDTPNSYPNQVKDRKISQLIVIVILILP